MSKLKLKKFVSLLVAFAVMLPMLAYIGSVSAFAAKGNDYYVVSEDVTSRTVVIKIIEDRPSEQTVNVTAPANSEGGSATTVKKIFTADQIRITNIGGDYTGSLSKIDSAQLNSEEKGECVFTVSGVTKISGHTGNELTFDYSYNNGPSVTVTLDLKNSFEQETAKPLSTASAYISNYRVVDQNGNSKAVVVPGDKVIIAVTVIDERINSDEFGVAAGLQTSRIHATMSQGAFSINSSNNVTVKLRDGVSVNGTNGRYKALCYTIEFRDVTYLGGTPKFSFGVSYTGANGTNTDNNVPLPYPHTTLEMSVTQATDDVPAPTIILNSANYGKVAIVGNSFNLVTVATNTSENLELENVSLKIELPSGINMATGNSQVLIGKVGKKGTINHTFNLVAEGVANDVTSLPVTLVYTFEAFVNGKRTQFVSEQELSINVQQPTRFSIQNAVFDEEMYMGSESYRSVSLVNKGKTTVYNVTAELVSNDFQGAEVEFIGNIAPGASAEAEFDFYAMNVGTGTGKIVITYEDASGIEYTLEREFSMEVLEEIVYDPGYDTPVVTPEEPENSNLLPIIIVVIIVAAVGGFYFYKKKKKAQEDLEDEDEDI